MCPGGWLVWTGRTSKNFVPRDCIRLAWRSTAVPALLLPPHTVIFLAFPLDLYFTFFLPQHHIHLFPLFTLQFHSSRVFPFQLLPDHSFCIIYLLCLLL